MQGDLGEAPRLTYEADGFIYELNVQLAAMQASDAKVTGPACGPQPGNMVSRPTLRVYKPRLCDAAISPRQAHFHPQMSRSKVSTSAPDDRVVRCQQE